MVALQSLPALVAGDAQGDAVLGAELLELGHDARGDDGVALGVQAVHHGLEERQLPLHRVRQEVGVDEDAVRGDEGLVVLEEELRGELGHLPAHDVARRARGGGGGGGGFGVLRVQGGAFRLVFWEARVSAGDYALYLEVGKGMLEAIRDMISYR